MGALDGNAIGGLLIDVFGADMTAATTICGTCGASRPVAELVVYRRAPGTVVRCRTCDSILMIFIARHAMIGVDLSGMASLDEPGSALSGGAGFRKSVQNKCAPRLVRASAAGRPIPCFPR